MPISKSLTRRKFFASTGGAALCVGSTGIAKAQANSTGYSQADSTMKFEVVRTAKEWREVLTEYEYLIMRDGLTEKPQSSPLWNETTDGTYSCKGCGLPNYTSNQKVVLDKGWVFFYHAEPDSVLMSIDGNIPEYYGAAAADLAALVEVHCRRCASHLGHFLIINNVMTHCINGTSLKFEPATV